MVPATAAPSFGSSVDPMTVWALFLNIEPRTERMTIANTETTMQVQALPADTTGFMLDGGRQISKYL